MNNAINLKLLTNFMTKNIFVKLQKQPPDGFCKKSYSWKFCKTHRKTPVPESLFNKVAGPRPATLLQKRLWHRPQAYNFIKKETLALVFSSEFCEIFKNNFFTEHLRTTASEKAVHKKNEYEKEREYNQQILQVEPGGSLTPFVLSCFGGMSRKCNRFFSHTAERLANRRKEPKSKIRTELCFNLKYVAVYAGNKNTLKC